MLFLRLGNLELVLVLGHRGGLNFQHTALGDHFDLSFGTFIVKVCAFELWFICGGDFHAVGELHHVMLCAPAKRKQQHRQTHILHDQIASEYPIRLARMQGGRLCYAG